MSMARKALVYFRCCKDKDKARARIIARTTFKKFGEDEIRYFSDESSVIYRKIVNNFQLFKG